MYGAPVLIALLSCGAALAFYSDPKQPIWLAILLGAAGLIAAYFLFRRTQQLRSVSLDVAVDGEQGAEAGREQWIISDGRSTIRIPLRHAVSVRERRIGSSRAILIRFRQDTGFGVEIEFLPRSAPVAPDQEHPIVEELRNLISGKLTTPRAESPSHHRSARRG